ncbi:MAG: thioredoxin [Minwuia sp.]|nr:thioredoxin [Minwuia sp.]
METIIGQPQGAAGQPAADLIKDSSIATFMEDVIQASQEVPVLVDFWAPWCEPCKQLTPVLEKVVTEAAGKIRLVKVNIDENQEIAQQMRIQSIPAVFAFKGGQPVDGFMGALPESQIREFISKVAGDIGPSPEEQFLEAGTAALEAGDGETAAGAFAQMIQANPESPQAFAGLVRAYVLLGDLDGAQEILEQVPVAISTHAEIAGAKAALELAQQSGDPAAMAEAERLATALAAAPDDMQVRFDHANALLAADQREEAVEALLECFRRDSDWEEQAARKKLVQLFEAWGNKDPLTLKARRRLSTLMFS